MVVTLLVPANGSIALATGSEPTEVSEEQTDNSAGENFITEPTAAQVEFEDEGSTGDSGNDVITISDETDADGESANENNSTGEEGTTESVGGENNEAEETGETEETGDKEIGETEATGDEGTGETEKPDGEVTDETEKPDSEVTDDEDELEDDADVDDNKETEEESEDEEDEDGITIKVNEDGSATVKIRGSKSWDDIAAKLSYNAVGATAVTFIGLDPNDGNPDKAAIEFMTDSDKLSFDYDVTFENVCLEAGYAFNASSTNGGKSGNFIKLFANGHKFTTTETVTTVGRVRVFGGGNEVSVGDTYVYLYGGDFDLVVGGSYANAVGDESQKYVSANNCTVYIGKDASAKGVVGGCLGGVNTGNISVDYASTSSKNVFVSGSSSDAIKEYAERSTADSVSSVNNPRGSITVKIEDGAVAGNVHGAMYSNVDVANINVTNNGTVTNIYGCVGSNDVYVSSLGLHYSAYGVYPGGNYYYDNSALKNYTVNANVNITNNGTVSSTIYGGYYDVDIKNVNIVNNGYAEYIYGGGYEGIYVTDKINVEVSAYGAAQYVFGGRMTGSWATYNNLSCDIQVTVYGTAGCVFGGGHDSLTTGSVNVDIYGTVSDSADNKAVSGGVYGGGWVTSTVAMQSSGDFFDGTATVTIHPGATVAGNVCGGAIDGTTTATKVYVYGTVNGDVYGGGWTQEEGKVYPLSYNPLTLYYFGLVGDSYVEVGDKAVVNSVYGGGQMANVAGDSTVVIKDEATINGDVCGAGNPYTSFYYGNTPYIISSNTKNVSGNAAVTIQGTPSIEGTIYGYRALDGDEDYDYVNGAETITFDGASGKFKRVMTASSVVVTNGSDVTIDYGGTDYEQLNRIKDLTIDKGGKLYLPASAYITGNYSGADTDNRGILALAAGKLLDVGGTISGWTNLSIKDTETTSPAAEQVYVISEAGSSPTDANAGKFTWIDQRNCVLLDWNSELTLTDDGSEPAAVDDEEAGDGDETEEETISATEWWLVPMSASATITPVSITSYVGGTSLNGNHIPQMRFDVETSAELGDVPEEYNSSVSVNADDLTFTLHDNRGKDHTVFELELTRIKEDGDTYYLIPKLDENLGNVGVGTDSTLRKLGTYLRLVDSTENTNDYSGIYSILPAGDYGADEGWYITASVGNTANGSLVNFVTTTEDGEPIAYVTVRKVSDQDGMYDTPTSYLTKVISSTDSINDSGKAYALFPAGTEFLTNDDSSLGLLGAGKNGYVDSDGNKVASNELVALLFDDITTLTLDVDTMQAKMMELAKDEESGLGLTTDGWNKDFRYLDLVNANDGNTVITANQDATVYWPYPTGITYEDASNYSFKILHYTGLNRESSIDKGTTLADAGVGVEAINVTATEYGLEFTTSSFSPFVLLYKANEVTLTYDTQCDEAEKSLLFLTQQ
jgi:hypothetical protein